MNAKQFLPLALLYATEDGRIEGRTRFQKLAFLAGEELQEYGVEPYDFIPYDYGPFDKTLLDELEKLETEGLVEINKTRTFGGDERYDYRLTGAGKESYQDNRNDQPDSDGEERFQTVEQVAEEIVKEYGEMPISNLIEYVYSEYPEYAENSVLY